MRKGSVREYQTNNTILDKFAIAKIIIKVVIILDYKLRGLEKILTVRLGKYTMLRSCL